MTLLSLCAIATTAMAQSSNAMNTSRRDSSEIEHREWPVWIIPNDSNVVMHDTTITVKPTTKRPIDPSTMTKVRLNGFRVQLYSGGNSRNDKLKAIDMAHTAKMYFEDTAVYTQFISPHWICRLGDFLTHEEAREMLHEVRETDKFPEAVIVKCKVNAWQ